MDIYSLIKDNASAVIGLIGVIVGATLTSIPVVFFNYYAEDGMCKIKIGNGEGIVFCKDYHLFKNG